MTIKRLVIPRRAAICNIALKRERWRSAKMFQLFLRARANSYFKARSASRDTETDQARVASIFRSIEDALEGVKAEHAGLKSRIDDMLARAAVTLGNESDEY